MSIKLKDQNNNEIFIAGTNSEDFINDKVLRNDKTWSSNKIVEELYPTFQKEGNPITCYPVKNYPLNVKATFSPKQAGIGDPSPENVRPISGWDSVKVTVSNESESHDYNITLPETIYGGTVDAVTGVGSEEWGIRTLNGSESWEVFDDGAFYFYDTISYPLINAVSARMCTHYMDYSGTAWVGLPDGYFSTNNASIRFKDSSIPDVESWKSYLASQASAGTPVQMAYKLATPTSFQASGNQALPAVAGLNTVYTDGDSLIISGKEDIKYTINQITSNIQNINQIQEINNILLGVE